MQGLVAVVVGVIWTLVLGTQVFSYGAGGKLISFNALGEWMAIAGMGIIFLTLIAGVILRSVLHVTANAPLTSPASAYENFDMQTRTSNTDTKIPMRTNASARDRAQNEPAFPPAATPAELFEDNAQFDAQYKKKNVKQEMSSRIKPLPARTPIASSPASGEWEPSMQEGLGLLKEEAVERRAAKVVPVSASNHASTPNGIPAANATAFNDQWEQLKRDIKAFNATAMQRKPSPADGSS
jgi:hypothetical protein